MKPSWGALLACQFAPSASFFLASCAAAPPPEAPTPAPSPVASAALAPPAPAPTIPLLDPPDAVAGLGALSPVGARDQGAALVLQKQQLVPFGLGVLAFGETPDRKDGAVPACALLPADGAGCRVFRMGLWKKPDPGASFSRLMPASAVASWGAPFRASDGWEHFTGGAKHIYATGGDGAVVDRIGVDGTVTPLLLGGLGLRGTRVVETGGDLMVVGADAVDDSGIPELVVLPLVKDDGQLVPGAPQRTKIIPWVSGMLAMNVRPWVKGGRRATVGPWTTAPVVTSEGALTSDFFLLWTEAIIPPRKGGARPTKIETPDCGGCGCLSSRLLEDGSVKKKVHLSRINAKGKVVSDKVLALQPPAKPSPEEEGIPQTLSPRLIATAGGVEVNGQAFDHSGKPTGAGASVLPADQLKSAPPFEHVTFQALEAAGYDEASGQGLAVLTEGTWLGSALFDGLGRRVGELSWIDHTTLPPLSGELVRVGERWLSLGKNKHQVAVLAGPDAGKVISIGPPPRYTLDGFAGLVAVKENQALAVRMVSPQEAPDRAGTILVSTIDLGAGTASEWEPMRGWMTGEPARPRLREVHSIRAEPGGSLVFTGLFEHKTKGAVWGELKRSPDETWGEPALLPSENTPAEIVEADKFRSKGCLFRFSTGPKRVVLVCNEPTDKDKPSARVGLRVLRL